MVLFDLTSSLVAVLLLACPVRASSLFPSKRCQIPLSRPTFFVSLGQTSIGARLI